MLVCVLVEYYKISSSYSLHQRPRRLRDAMNVDNKNLRVYNEITWQRDDGIDGSVSVVPGPMIM